MMIYLYLRSRISFYDFFEDSLKNNGVFEDSRFINSNVTDILILSELSFIRSIETFTNFLSEKDINEKELDNVFFSNYDVENLFFAFLDLFLDKKIHIKKLIKDINVVFYKEENKVYYDWGIHQDLIDSYVQMLDRKYVTDKTYSKNFMRSKIFITDIVFDSIKDIYENTKLKTLFLLLCLYNIKKLYSLDVIDTIITYDLISDVKQYFLSNILVNNKYKFNKIYKNVEENFKEIVLANKIDIYIEEFKKKIGVNKYVA